MLLAEHSPIRLVEYDITFEDIKHIDENSNEYWYARELQGVLGYKEWRYFSTVIEKAQIACINSNNNVDDHFGAYTKMVKIGSKAKRNIKDYKLSRYACYLIAQNGDSHMSAIALAQTYFAVQTRKMEILEDSLLTEDGKRLYRRELAKKGNKELNKTALNCGIKPRNLGKFHNEGYKGLYNGETADDIAKRKGLRYREDILDNMSSEELGANIFRITQTEALLNKQEELSEKLANDTHYRVGKKVRDTIMELGGTMPENLPTPNKSLKEFEQKNVKN